MGIKDNFDSYGKYGMTSFRDFSGAIKTSNLEQTEGVYHHLQDIRVKTSDALGEVETELDSIKSDVQSVLIPIRTEHIQNSPIGSLPVGSLESPVADWEYTGLTLVNQFTIDADTAYTPVGSGGYLKPNTSDGLISVSPTYSISKQEINVTSGDVIFIYAKVDENTIQNGVGIQYSDNSVQTDINSTSATKEAYGRITASTTDVVNPFIIENNSGIITTTEPENWCVINQTKLGIVSYSEDLMLDLVRGGYFEGIKSVENPSIETSGKNLFNKNIRYTLKGLDSTTGKLIPATTSDTSDFIKVKSNTAYYLSGKTVARYYCLYDAQKEFVSSALIINGTIATGNSSYIRITVLQGDVEIIQLEEGSISTTYKPYESSQVKIQYPLRGVRDGITDGVYEINGDMWLQKNISNEESILSATVINTTNLPTAKSGGYFILLQDDGTLICDVIDGSTTTTDDGIIIYELATSKTINLSDGLKTVGLLQSYKNGTMYLGTEYYKKHLSSGEIVTLDENVLSIKRISYIDVTNNEIVILTDDDYTFTSGTNSITGLPVSNIEYLIEAEPIGSLFGEFVGNIPTNQAARTDSAIDGIDRNSKQIDAIYDILKLLM